MHLPDTPIKIILLQIKYLTNYFDLEKKNVLNISEVLLRAIPHLPFSLFVLLTFRYHSVR